MKMALCMKVHCLLVFVLISLVPSKGTETPVLIDAVNTVIKVVTDAKETVDAMDTELGILDKVDFGTETEGKNVSTIAVSLLTTSKEEAGKAEDEVKKLKADSTIVKEGLVALIDSVVKAANKSKNAMDKAAAAMAVAKAKVGSGKKGYDAIQALVLKVTPAKKAVDLAKFVADGVKDAVYREKKIGSGSGATRDNFAFVLLATISTFLVSRSL